MERSRVALITLMCVWFSRISGEEVEVKVRPGDDAVLYCDCVWTSGFLIVWFRNSSHERTVFHKEDHPRYITVRNLFSRTTDLLVRNVSEPDLGLYYCALLKIQPIRNKARACSGEDVCLYGNRTTRLSFHDTTPPVSDCSVCWKLLVSVCPVCVLLSSVVSSTCVYYICRYTTKVGEKPDSAESSGETTRNPTNRRHVKADRDDVCYASLDLPRKGQKQQKKKRVESSDFCTYSEVKVDRM